MSATPSIFSAVFYAVPAASGAVHQQNPPDAGAKFLLNGQTVLYRGIQDRLSLSDSLTLIAENFLQCPCIESNYRGRMQIRSQTITPVRQRSRSGSAVRGRRHRDERAGLQAAAVHFHFR
ncbi:hypothetical protein ECZU24_59420 [Escherichia coli]|nr:hypothetical protein ECZU24_59420 [Escherichia coli]